MPPISVELAQLRKQMEGTKLGQQLYKAIDSNNDAHLICYERFLDDNIVDEDLLFCKSIFGSVKAQDLF